MTVTDAAPLPGAVLEALQQGRKIEASRRPREAAGLDPHDARARANRHLAANPGAAGATVQRRCGAAGPAHVAAPLAAAAGHRSLA